MKENKYGVIGRITSIEESEFTSRDNTPFKKAVITLKYLANVYSWKRNESFPFEKDIIFEHISTNYPGKEDPIFDELKVLQSECMDTPNVMIAVEFYISSESKTIHWKKDGEDRSMDKVEHAIKMNSIRKHAFDIDSEADDPVDEAFHQGSFTDAPPIDEPKKYKNPDGLGESENDLPF